MESVCVCVWDSNVVVLLAEVVSVFFNTFSPSLLFLSPIHFLLVMVGGRPRWSGFRKDPDRPKNVAVVHFFFLKKKIKWRMKKFIFFVAKKKERDRERQKIFNSDVVCRWWLRKVFFLLSVVMTAVDIINEYSFHCSSNTHTHSLFSPSFFFLLFEQRLILSSCFHKVEHGWSSKSKDYHTKLYCCFFLCLEKLCKRHQT